MKQRVRIFAITVILMLGLTTVNIKAQTTNQKKNPPAPAASQPNAVQPAAGATTVTGSGTAGKIVKWTGNNGTSYVVGDSIITEDKTGKIGIGNAAPNSKLTVAGTIETTQGGVKFPDGTVQTTAAFSSGDSAQSVFQISLTGSFDSNGNLTGSFPVPAGKRMVIEYVSIDVLLADSADVVTLSELATTVGGIFAEHRIRPLRVEPNRGDFSVDKSVRIYADGGTNVLVALSHDQSGSAGVAAVSISGHYLNIP